MELREYLRIIKKRLWMIAAFVIITCTTVALYSYYLTVPMYEASTKLIVNKSSDSVLNQLNWSDVNTNIQLIATYKELITTSAIMDKVVQTYPDLGETADDLINKVRVSSVNETQVMTVIATDSSYRHAAEIANAVSSVFQQEIPAIMKVDNVTILDKAKLDDDPFPVAPKPKLNIAISFVVSLMLGIGLSFLMEYFDDTLKSEEDIEKVLGLPTLAVISQIRAGHRKSKSVQPLQQKAGDSTYVTINQ